MPAKHKQLCEKCKTARDDIDDVRALIYLVHPVSRRPRLFDVHGHADCPDCGARWHRGTKRFTLVSGD